MRNYKNFFGIYYLCSMKKISTTAQTDNLEGLEKRILSVFANNTNKDYSIKQVYGILGYKDRAVKLKVKEIIMDMMQQNILIKSGTRFVLHPQYVSKDTSPKHYVTGITEFARRIGRNPYSLGQRFVRS